MKAIRDWRAFIDRIGFPEKAFKHYEGVVNYNIRYRVILHKLTGTSIWFYLPKDNNLNLLCVYFINSNTKGWSGELKDLHFCTENIRKADEFLRPALVTGWQSIDYYLMGKYFSSCVREKSDGSGKMIQKFSSYYRFWSYLMFPLCYLMDQMILNKIIGTNNSVEIQPIQGKPEPKEGNVFSLVYRSVASSMFDNSQISGLLERARDFNRSCEISGCLLYYKGEFVQYLEGDRQEVLSLFENIKKDIRHKEVCLLSTGQSFNRQFNSWDMAYEDFLGKNDHLLFLELLLSSFLENPDKSAEPDPSSVYFWKTARQILATRKTFK